MEGSESEPVKKEDWIKKTRAAKRAVAQRRCRTVGLRMLLEDDPLWSLIVTSTSRERERKERGAEAYQQEAMEAEL